jgi:hypothetical protein
MPRWSHKKTPISIAIEEPSNENLTIKSPRLESVMSKFTDLTAQMKLQMGEGNPLEIYTDG